MVDSALAVGVEKMTDSPINEITAELATAADADWEAGNGLSFVALNALLMKRYMHEYGWEKEHFAQFAVNAHANAMHNPFARFHSPATVEGYLKAPMVNDPINLMDASPTGDGAAAAIFTFEDRNKIGQFDLYTDGKGYDKLIVKNGGFRFPSDPEAPEKVYGADNIFTDNHLFINKSLSASDLDPENIMIFSVLFDEEKHLGYSQNPDKNSFEAHYVDAVNATWVIQGGNLPPEIGIQNPAVKYYHRFGNPIRKSLTGKTVVVGKTTIVASAYDDSQIEKVEFYINNKLMATITQDPYQWTWHKFSLGKKTITIKAYDDSGKQSTASMDVVAFML